MCIFINAAVRRSSFTSAYFWVYVSAVSMSEVTWHQMRSSRKITSGKTTGLLIEVITFHYAGVVTNSIEEGR